MVKSSVFKNRLFISLMEKNLTYTMESNGFGCEFKIFYSQTNITFDHASTFYREIEKCVK